MGQISALWARRPIPARGEHCELLGRLSPRDMEDIDQSRFALMTALGEAHKSRPDEYPDSDTLVAMSDEGLRAYALGLLQLLDGVPAHDSVETELLKELRLIIGDTH